MFIDTHSHLTFPDFEKDLPEVISRARDVGVYKIIVPAISFETSVAAVALAEKFDSIYAAVGVHPQDAGEFQSKQVDELFRITEHPKVVAVGEIGLDYYRDYAPHSLQQEVFHTFLEMAVSSTLPVIIHNRAAFKDVVTILKQQKYNGLNGVFHCFPGEAQDAELVIEMGFSVSFTGTITFKNSHSASVARAVPLAELLLETDAPFMAPVPKRGRRNEPAFIPYIAEKLAQLHDVSVNEAAQLTTQHALQLFPKLNNGHK